MITHFKLQCYILKRELKREKTVTVGTQGNLEVNNNIHQKNFLILIGREHVNNNLSQTVQKVEMKLIDRKVGKVQQ